MTEAQEDDMVHQIQHLRLRLKRSEEEVERFRSNSVTSPPELPIKKEEIKDESGGTSDVGDAASVETAEGLWSFSVLFCSLLGTFVVRSRCHFVSSRP